MKNFIKQQWVFVLSAVIFVFAILLYVITDHGDEQHIISGVTLTLSTFSMLIVATKERFSYKKDMMIFCLSTSMYFLAISLVWFLSLWVYLVPILMFIIGMIHARLLQENLEWFDAILLAGFVAALCGGLLLICEEAAERERAIRDNQETVVINYVDKKEKHDVRVFIEGKGIFSFFKSEKTEDCWKLNNGDTVQIAIHDNQIVSLRR